MAQIDILSKITKLPEMYKKEMLFSINNYKKMKELNDYEGVIQNFANLLLMEPNTYPDEPDMGINVKSYTFSQMNEINLSDLVERVKAQCDLYLPNFNLIDIEFTKIFNPKTNDYTDLGITLQIQKLNQNNINQFYLVLQQEETSNNILQILVNKGDE